MSSFGLHALLGAGNTFGQVWQIRAKILRPPKLFLLLHYTYVCHKL